MSLNGRRGCCGGDIETCTCGKVLGLGELRLGTGMCFQCLQLRQLPLFEEDPDERPYIWDLEED